MTNTFVAARIKHRLLCINRQRLTTNRTVPKMITFRLLRSNFILQFRRSPLALSFVLWPMLLLILHCNIGRDSIKLFISSFDGITSSGAAGSTKDHCVELTHNSLLIRSIRSIKHEYFLTVKHQRPTPRKRNLLLNCMRAKHIPRDGWGREDRDTSMR